MQNSKLYMRGQIWYWTDPSYGDKVNNKLIELGEGGLRYNRYVMIIQDEDTIGSGPILCIPLSSKKKYGSDVPLHIAHLHDEAYSYARPRQMFSVHPAMLKDYVCTVPDGILSQIDAELAQLLLPSVTSVMSRAQLRENFGFTFTAVKESVEQPERSRLRDHIKWFAKECLKVTSSPDDVLDIYEIKDLYDAFCCVYHLPFVDDIVYFAEAFEFHMNPGSFNSTHFDGRVRHLKFRGLQIRNVPDVVIDCANSDAAKITKEHFADSIEQDVQREPRGPWTKELKQAFVLEWGKCENSEDKEKVAQRYSCAVSSARHYFAKWKPADGETHNGPPQKSSHHSKEQSPKKRYNFNRLTTGDYLDAISVVVNNIVKEIMDERVLNGSKHDNKNGYDKISAAFYFSFIDVLNMDNSNKGFIPNVEAKKNIGQKRSWEALKHILKDSELDKFQNISEIDQTDHDNFLKYDCVAGFDYAIWEEFETKIIYKYRLGSDVARRVKSAIGDLFRK